MYQDTSLQYPHVLIDLLHENTPYMHVMKNYLQERAPACSR